MTQTSSVRKLGGQRALSREGRSQYRSYATSTCQAQAKLGEACNTPTGPGCLTGLTCDQKTSTCVSSYPPGPACI
jgi:hypothetical protein